MTINAFPITPPKDESQQQPNVIRATPVLTPQRQAETSLQQRAIDHIVNQSQEPDQMKANMQIAEELSRMTGQSVGETFSNLTKSLRGLGYADNTPATTVWEDLSRRTRNSFANAAASNQYHRAMFQGDGTRESWDERTRQRIEAAEAQMVNVDPNLSGNRVIEALQSFTGFLPSLVEGTTAQLIGGMSAAGLTKAFAVKGAAVGTAIAPGVGTAAGIGVGMALGGAVSYFRRASGGIYGDRYKKYEQELQEWENTPEDLRGERPTWNTNAERGIATIFGALSAASTAILQRFAPGLMAVEKQIASKTINNLAAEYIRDANKRAIVEQFGSAVAQSPIASFGVELGTGTIQSVVVQGASEFFQSGLETAGRDFEIEFLNVLEENEIRNQYVVDVFTQGVQGARAAMLSSFIPIGPGYAALQSQRAQQHSRRTAQFNEVITELQAADVETAQEAAEFLRRSADERENQAIREELINQAEQIEKEPRISPKEIKIEVTEDGRIKGYSRDVPAIELKYDQLQETQTSTGAIVDIGITEFKVKNTEFAHVVLQQAIRELQKDGNEINIAILDLSEQDSEMFTNTLQRLSPEHVISRMELKQAEMELEQLTEREKELTINLSFAERDPELWTGPSTAQDIQTELQDIATTKTSKELEIIKLQSKIQGLPTPDYRLLHEINYEALHQDLQTEITARGVNQFDVNDPSHDDIKTLIKTMLPHMNDLEIDGFLEFMATAVQSVGPSIGATNLADFLNKRFAPGVIFKQDRRLDMSMANGALIEMRNLQQAAILVSEDTNFTTLVHEFGHAIFNMLPLELQQKAFDYAQKTVLEYPLMNAEQQFDLASELFTDALENVFLNNNLESPLSELTDIGATFFNQVYQNVDQLSVKIPGPLKEMLRKVFTPGEVTLRPFDALSMDARRESQIDSSTFVAKYHANQQSDEFWVQEPTQDSSSVSDTNLQAMAQMPGAFGYTEQALETLYGDDLNLGEREGLSKAQVIQRAMDQGYVPVTIKNNIVSATIPDTTKGVEKLQQFLIDAIAAGVINPNTQMSIFNAADGRDSTAVLGGVAAFIQSRSPFKQNKTKQYRLASSQANQNTYGLVHFSNTPGLKRLDPAFQGGFVRKQPLRKNAEPNPFVQKSVSDYNKLYGLGEVVQGHYAPVEEQLARDMAAAYDALPSFDDSPEVREAYAQLEAEIKQQWDFATKVMGITFEAWDAEGQPYQNSREMVRDVRDNKHLWFFTGGEPHPLLDNRDQDGLTANERLRAIHDLFGHAAEDYQFGPRGEENAWIKHSQMFTPLAQKALTTETRGQNSWVNYGAQNYAADGTRLNIPPQDRPFAEQKVALLPDEYMDWQAAIAKSPTEMTTESTGNQSGAERQVAIESRRVLKSLGYDIEPVPYLHTYVGNTGAPEARFAQSPAKYRVSLPRESVYDLSTDPDNILQQVREQYSQLFGPQESVMSHPDLVHNEIKNRGYKGWTVSQHPSQRYKDSVMIYSEIDIDREYSKQNDVENEHWNSTDLLDPVDGAYWIDARNLKAVGIAQGATHADMLESIGVENEQQAIQNGWIKATLPRETQRNAANFVVAGYTFHKQHIEDFMLNAIDGKEINLNTAVRVYDVLTGTAYEWAPNNQEKRVTQQMSLEEFESFTLIEADQKAEDQPQNVSFQDFVEDVHRPLFQKKEKFSKQSMSSWVNWNPERNADGSYKGADHIKNKRQFNALINRMKQLIDEGVRGRYWYELSSERIMDLSGLHQAKREDRPEAINRAYELISVFTQQLAIYSPQTPVDTNVVFALRAMEQYAAGQEINVKTQVQDRKALAAFNNEYWEGRKTNSFYLNLMHRFLELNPDAIQVLGLDKIMAEPDKSMADLIMDHVSTVDVWMVRSAGYKVEAAGSAILNGKYPWVENMTRYLAGVYNQNLKPGEDQWLPHQIQAAIWVGVKTRWESKVVTESHKQRKKQYNIKNGIEFDDSVINLAYRVYNKETPELTIEEIESLLQRSDDMTAKQLGQLRELQKKGDAIREDWVIEKERWAKLKEEIKKRDEALTLERAKQAYSLPYEEVMENARAARGDFNDFINQYSQTITAEAIPSSGVGAEINGASHGVRRKFTEEAMNIFIDPDTGENQLNKYFNVIFSSGFEGVGTYLENVSPNILYTITVAPETTTPQKKSIPQPTRNLINNAKVRAIAAILQHVTMQEAVPWFAPKPMALLSKSDRDNNKYRVVKRVVKTEDGEVLAPAKSVYRDDSNRYAENLKETLDQQQTLKTFDDLNEAREYLAKQKIRVAKEKAKLEEQYAGDITKMDDKEKEMYLAEVEVTGGRLQDAYKIEFENPVTPANLRAFQEYLLIKIGVEGITQLDTHNVLITNYNNNNTPYGTFRLEDDYVPPPQFAENLKNFLESDAWVTNLAGVFGIEKMPEVAYVDGEYGPVVPDTVYEQGREVDFDDRLRQIIADIPSGAPDLESLRSAIQTWSESYDRLLEEYSGTELIAKERAYGPLGDLRPLFQRKTRGFQRTPAGIGDSVAARDRAAHAADVEYAVAHGHYVKNSILSEYLTEDWAMEAYHRRRNDATRLAEAYMGENPSEEFWAAKQAKDIFEFYDLVGIAEEVGEQRKPMTERFLEMVALEYYDIYHLAVNMNRKQANKLFMQMLRKGTTSDDAFFNHVMERVGQAINSDRIPEPNRVLLAEVLRIAGEDVQNIPTDLRKEVIDIINGNVTEFRRMFAVGANDVKEIHRLAREQYFEEGDVTLYSEGKVNVPFLKEFMNLDEATIQLLREYGVESPEMMDEAQLEGIFYLEQEKLREIEADIIRNSGEQNAETVAEEYRVAAQDVRKLANMIVKLQSSADAQQQALVADAQKKMEAANKKISQLKEDVQWERLLSEEKQNRLRAKIAERNAIIQRMKDVEKMRKARKKLNAVVFNPPQKNMKSEWSQMLKALQNGVRPTKKNAATREQDKALWATKEDLFNSYGGIFAEDLQILYPDWLDERMFADPSEYRFRDITNEQLVELAEFVTYMREAGKSIKEAWKATREAKKNRFVSTIEKGILDGDALEFDKDPYSAEGANRQRQMIGDFWYSTYNAQRLADKLDGYKAFQGPVFNLMWNGYKDAESQAILMRNKYTTALNEYMKSNNITPRDLSQQITVIDRVSIEDFAYGDTNLEEWAEANDIGDIESEVTYQYTASEVMGIYLAMQDQNTAETVIFGDRIPPKVVDQLVAQLDKNLVDMVENRIAKDFAELFPILERQSIDLYDMVLQGVDRYIPIYLKGEKYESMESQIVLENQHRAGMVNSTTQKGMIKSRTNMKPEYRRPMELNLMALYARHIDQVARFIHVEPHAQLMNAALTSDRVKMIAKQKNKSAILKEFKNWADAAISNKKNVEPNIWKTLRYNSTVAALSASIPVVLRQPVSMMYYMGMAGPQEVFKSIGYAITNPGQLQREVMEIDPGLIDRIMDRDRKSIQEKSMESINWKNAVSKIGEAGMGAISAFDAATVAIGTHAMYNHLKDRMSPEEAARGARNVTARTQPVGAVADVPGFLREDNFLSLFTQFSSQLSQIFGMATHDVWSFGNQKQAKNAIMVATSVILGQYLIWAMRNAKLGPEDEEELGKMLVDMYLTPLPVIGPMISSTVNGFDSGVPAFSFIDSGVQAAMGLPKVLSGEATEAQQQRVVRQILRALGPLTGGPMAALTRGARALDSDNPIKLLILGRD